MERLKLTETQKNILRGYSGGWSPSGITVGLLARARKDPELARHPGQELLAAAVEMLDAGYFMEPSRWDLRKVTLRLKDDTPAELTEFGEKERERLSRDDWR